MFDILSGHTHHRRAPNYRGTAVSVLAHGAVLAALLWAGSRAQLPVADGGTAPGMTLGDAGGGGGGGGEHVTFYELQAPAPAVTAEPAVVVPPPPVEAPTVQPPITPPVAPPVPARTDSAPSTLPAPMASSGSGSGMGEGGGAGPGTGPGTGPGAGGGSGGGSGGGVGTGTGPGAGAGRITPPETDLLLIPPPRPRSMPSRTVVFVLEVDTEGVVRNVEIQPSTGDRRYDAALRRMALEWRFRPARDAANRPVAVKYPVTLTI